MHEILLDQVHQAAIAEDFALVISDVCMPEVDGHELLSRIKADSDLAATPVVLLSSACQVGEKVKSRELGAAGFLVKPVEESELLQAMVVLEGDEELLLEIAQVFLDSSRPRLEEVRCSLEQ
jgi:CheY-like chemotaxis protein